MDGESRYLATPSLETAKEWSLVLISQGIETVIRKEEEPGGYFIEISLKEEWKALDVLRRFLVENRHTPADEVAVGDYPLFHPGSLLWGLFLTLIFYTDNSLGGNLKQHGMMVAKEVQSGEWWRLFTAIMLHGDLLHLIANFSFGFIFLGIAMGRFGSAYATWFSLAGGAAANAGALYMYPDSYRSLGASGMIMACLGMITLQNWGTIRNRSNSLHRIFPPLCAGILLFVLTGFSPESDVIVHSLGYLAGLGLGLFLSFIPEYHLQNPAANFRATFLLLIWIITVWRFALYT